MTFDVQSTAELTARPVQDSGALTAGSLVMTCDGELGEITHAAFGMVAVRLAGIGGGCATTVYYRATDLTPVVCPADVVTADELAALHDLAAREAA